MTPNAGAVSYNPTYQCTKGGSTVGKLIPLIAALLAVLSPAVAQQTRPAAHPARLSQRWVYLATNLLADRNVLDAITLVERAKRAGYTGLVLNDTRFMQWDAYPPGMYHNKVALVRERCRELGLQCVAGVMPVGYSGAMPWHDPNLAAGLPVRDAPFVARYGQAEPADTAELLTNGNFDDGRDHRPAAWGLVDQPGAICFLDADTRYAGRHSLRIQDVDRHDPRHGNGRVMQSIDLAPYRQYRVSYWIKTHALQRPEAFAIRVIGPDRAMMNFYQPPLQSTQPWTQVQFTFNSLWQTRANFYLGVWKGGGGTIWLDEVSVAPCGPVNVLRREGTPVRVASDDGGTVYQEGVDYKRLFDPGLYGPDGHGRIRPWHSPVPLEIPPGSRIAEGQWLRVSYYHPTIIQQSQIVCSLIDPKVFDLLDWQIRRVKQYVAPDGYFMNHDEIRVAGWDAQEAASGKTPGELLAHNARACVQIIRAHAGPDAPVYVWNDMFDPHHNAYKDGRYYLVNGSWYGSWEGLDREVIIANWRRGEADSLRFFAERGHRQILCGYYDEDPRAILRWLELAKDVPGVIGVMYTTWEKDYDDLEAFSQAVDEFLAENPPR